jgi:hypothetical protein
MIIDAPSSVASQVKFRILSCLNFSKKLLADEVIAALPIGLGWFIVVGLGGS